MAGIFEIILIASVIVVAFGFRHLPKIGKYIAHSASAFKKGLRGESDNKIREINPPK